MERNQDETRVDAILRRAKNQRLTAWAVILFIVVVGLGQLTGALKSIGEFIRRAPSADLPRSDVSSGDVIVGKWEHYEHVADESWALISQISVTKDSGRFVILPIQQDSHGKVDPSYGITDVESDGSHWRFKSDWGNGDVGQFDLLRVSPDLFEGVSYSLNGNPRHGRGNVKFHRVN